MKGQKAKSRESEFDELAYFSGGEPAFAAPVHVGVPNLGDRGRLLGRIGAALDAGRLSNGGPFCREFERRVADRLGVRHCVAASSATRALEVLVKALGLSGEVIVPALTFVATAHALEWVGLRPVFCDVEPETLTLDPARVEELISPRTTAVLGVHLWGRACRADELRSLADRRGLKLIFDAAHAFDCSYKSRPIGNFGEAEVLSFHATKFLNTAEGGAIVTNRDDLADEARRMINFGLLEDKEQVAGVGTNGKMSEIAAAVGLAGLESIDDFLERNRRSYLQYRRELGGLKGVRVLAYDEREKNNYQFVVISVGGDDESGLTRDRLMKILHAENVMARRYFYPGCHRAEPYRTRYPVAAKNLPVTETALARVLALPTGAAVGAADVSRICRIIRLAVRLAETTRNFAPGEAD